MQKINAAGSRFIRQGCEAYCSYCTSFYKRHKYPHGTQYPEQIQVQHILYTSDQYLYPPQNVHSTMRFLQCVCTRMFIYHPAKPAALRTHDKFVALHCFYRCMSPLFPLVHCFYYCIFALFPPLHCLYYCMHPLFPFVHCFYYCIFALCPPLHCFYQCTSSLFPLLHYFFIAYLQ